MSIASVQSIALKRAVFFKVYSLLLRELAILKDHAVFSLMRTCLVNCLYIIINTYAHLSSSIHEL